MKNILFLFFSLIFLCAGAVQSQNIISIDVSKVTPGVLRNEYDMGNPGPPGRKIKINNLYMTISGKPVIPVMGEMHYVRVPKAGWQDRLLKMKAAGINIVSTYVFWIYHEEIEGEFNWSGNRDLRAFLKLCKKDGLYVFLRIGPWSHGEVRNGGFPDWLLQKRYIHPRSEDPVFQHYVKQYFAQIATQVRGLLYKNGGPVIGIQLENEYSGGKKGEQYIMWLKKTAIEDGMDVPMYAVTGWGNTSIPKDQVIPLWGGYPGAPWNPDLKKIKNNPSFTFGDPRSPGNIFQGKKQTGYHPDTKIYPFFTVEMGLGNQITYHRRPVFSAIDGLAIAVTRLGSGANMLGYYMFTGGSDQTGTLTTLEEDRKNTGYWNRYPIISYDFQTAIRETGELAPSYYQIKKLNYFVDEFGSRLAPMMPVIGPQKNPHKKLLYSVRVKGGAGYLFGSNYYRGVSKPEQKNIQFNIKLRDERLRFPQKPVDIPDSSVFIWPFNFMMSHVLLKYATAQPLCRIRGKEGTDWFFIQNRGIRPEFCFDPATLSDIHTSSGSIMRDRHKTIISGIQPGLNAIITIRDKNGNVGHIHVLSSEEAKHVWLFDYEGVKYLFLSKSNLYLDHNRLHVYGPANKMKITELAGTAELSDGHGILSPKQSGVFPEYDLSVPEQHISLDLKSHPILSDATWLKASVDKVNPENELWHRFFIKEFNLGDPAKIKSAKMILFSQIPCNIRINGTWLNQSVKAGGLNDLDITGYVRKGKNALLLAFPFMAGDSAFAATIKVGYENSNQIQFSTDRSWLTWQSYTYPAPWDHLTKLQAPDTAGALKPDYNRQIQPREWTLTIPDGYLNGLSNLYLHIHYIGDRAQCRLHYRLIADNFNNGASWNIALKKFGDRLAGQQLRLEVYPLNAGYKVYFDRKPSPEDLGRADITGIRTIPEYEKTLILSNSQ